MSHALLANLRVVPLFGSHETNSASQRYDSQTLSKGIVLFIGKARSDLAGTSQVGTTPDPNSMIEIASQQSDSPSRHFGWSHAGYAGY